MKKQTLFATLFAIATQQADGFTVNANTLENITSGYAVAMAETQNSFGAEGLQKVIAFAKANKNVNAFGGWYDKKSGLYYWDAVVIVDDYEYAKSLGRQNKQLAIFDLTNCREIRL